MGRKPVVGLVGACLASVALAGCCDNCWPGGWRKDTKDTAATGSTNGSRVRGDEQAWRTGPVAPGTGNSVNGGTTTGSTGGVTGGNAFGAGGGTAGGMGASGSFNGTGRAPVTPYPDNNTMRSPVGTGAGGLSPTDRTPYPGSPGADLNGGRTTGPTSMTTGFGDSGTDNLPPAPPMGARPVPSVLSPFPPSGPPVPRTDILPPASAGRPPVSASPTIQGMDPGVRTVGGTNDSIPPPAPPPVTSPSFSGGGDRSGIDLPPPPVSPSLGGFRAPPLPAPTPGGISIPAPPPSVMQPGRPME